MQSAATYPAKVFSHRSTQQKMEKQKKLKPIAGPVKVLKSTTLKI
jgi:hypothetical protein